MENKELTTEQTSTILTDEQVDYIAEEMDNFIKGTKLEEIANYPSNNNVLERSPEDITEKGEIKLANISVDPNTGENKIFGPAEDTETFEEMYERMSKDGNIKLDNTPITGEELSNLIKSENSDSILSEITSGTDLSDDAIKDLLVLVNRRMNKEEFNVYKAYPQEIRDMIDKYVSGSHDIHLMDNSREAKQFRNYISEALIDEFISNISLERVKTDFGKEIEDLFNKGSEELADAVVGYTEERNRKYREYANSIDDESKKEKINEILDSIDEAYNLETLKEFAKRCKIKNYELERPDKVFDSFLNKYKNSLYNIYSIEMARPILFRNITELNEDITDKDINAFFIVFCKQCLNMSPENKKEHAYMYYVLYNIVLMDMNKGKSKDISDKYVENILDVIKNIKTRNNF